MRVFGYVVVAFVLAGCKAAPNDQQVVQAGVGLRLASGSVPLNEDGPVRVRRLWNQVTGGFYAMTAAPNGTFATNVDWSHGDLGIIDFVRQEARRVTDKGSWTESIDYAETSVVSPDNARIAYAWFSSETQGYQLRVIDVDGSDMHVLLESSPTQRYIEAEDWSDDGQTIATTIFRRDGTNQIALVDAATGDVRVLKTLDWRWPQVASVSPDGRYLAYDFPSDENRFARDVYVIAIDGSVEHHVVDNASDDQLLGWLPDGDLLFYSDRSVWQLPMNKGDASGEAVLVRADVWNLEPIGMASSSYIYGVNVERPQVHTALIDLDEGRLLTDPAPVSTRVVRQTGYSTWSVDGKFLAYLAPPQGSPTTIVIRSIETGEEQELLVRANNATHLIWEPSGEAIWFFGKGMRGHAGLHRVVLATGQLEHVALTLPEMFGGDEPHRRISFSPDGNTLYMRAMDRPGTGSAAPRTVIAYELATGEIRRLYETLGNSGRVSVSPDGQSIAFVDANWGDGEHVLRIGSADGSSDARTVYRFAEGYGPAANHGNYDWTPDGRHVVIVERNSSASRITLVDVRTGSAKVVYELAADRGRPITQLRLDPTGRYVSFDAGRVVEEIWVMEGLSEITSTN